MIWVSGWSPGPLRSGLLRGKYNPGRPAGTRLSLNQSIRLSGILSDENLDRARKISRIAGDLGLSPAQLAIGWILRKPQVSGVIAGATKVEQVVENAGALDVVQQLDEEVLNRIEAALGNAFVAEN